MAIKTGRGDTLSGFNQFSSCCGSRYVENRKERKWKNQYGEGITKGRDADPIKDNSHGILLAEGFCGVAGQHGKFSIHHIKTSNGNITISLQEKM